GAVICFLAFLGFFLLDGKHKWWMLAASILGIVMSWGSYFAGFNSVLLHLLPGYDKFRAPSLIILIPNFLFCTLAILSLDKLLKLSAADRPAAWQQYKKGLYLSGGVFVLLLLCYVSFDYTGGMDKLLLQQMASFPSQVQEYAHTFLRELHAD